MFELAWGRGWAGRGERGLLSVALCYEYNFPSGVFRENAIKTKTTI